MMKKPKRINSVSVALALMALAFLYFLWAVVPTLWPLWQMSGIMRTACSVAYSEADDEVVMQRLVKDGRRTKLRISKDNFLLERVAFTEDEILAAPERLRGVMSKKGKECVLRFRYVDTYALPLLGLEYELPYESKVTLSLQPDETANYLNDLVYNSCTCTRTRSGGAPR